MAAPEFILKLHSWARVASSCRARHGDVVGCIRGDDTLSLPQRCGRSRCSVPRLPHTGSTCDAAGIRVGRYAAENSGRVGEGRLFATRWAVALVVALGSLVVTQSA